MIEKLLIKLLQMVRSWKDKCIYCGGDIWCWDTRKCYCKDCEEKQ